MKPKPCKHCKSELHTSLKCFNAPRKPLRRSVGASKVKKAKTPVKKKPKAKTRSYYVKQLDTIYSQYIRLKDSRNGMAECVTCGDVKPWNLQQNGHYMSRGYQSTRWLDTNCHVQCVACNVFRSGNYTEYAIFMVNRYGADHLIELQRLAKTGGKISTPELREKIEYYRGEVDKMIKKY